MTEAEIAPVQDQAQAEEPSVSYTIPGLSVVIPTYGPKGVELTRNCIESLIRTHSHLIPGIEIITVSDGDEEMVMQALTELANETGTSLIRIERRGFAAACNAGIRRSNGQVGVFLVNNDIEFEVNTLQVLADAMLANTAGIIGCRLLYPDRTIQHAGVVYVPANGQQVPGYFDHLLRYRFELDVDAVVMHHGLVTGALMGIHRHFIERSGLLDERFPFTAEDIDLCLRAIECGMPPVYCGYTYAIHREGASRGRTMEEKIELEPEIAKKEMDSLSFLFKKWIGFDFNQFVPGRGISVSRD